MSEIVIEAQIAPSGTMGSASQSIQSEEQVAGRHHSLINVLLCSGTDGCGIPLDEYNSAHSSLGQRDHYSVSDRAPSRLS